MSFFFFFFGPFVVVVIVYHPCGFIIGLAVRHTQQTLLTSTCDGTVVTQHGVFHSQLLLLLCYDSVRSP